MKRTHKRQSHKGMNINALKETTANKDSFFNLLMFYAINFPVKSAGVALGTLLLGVLETLGTATLLPLLSIGLNQEAGMESMLMQKIETIFAYVNVSLEFNHVLFVFIIIILAKVICNLALGIYVDYSKDHITKDFRLKVIKKIKNARWDYFVKQSNGILVNLIGYEADRAASSFTTLQKVVTSAFLVCVYLMVGTAFSATLILGAGAIALISFFIFKPLIKRTFKAGVGQTEHMRELASDTQQGISVLKAFKAMAKEMGLLLAIDNHSENIANSNRLRVVSNRALIAGQEIMTISVILVAFFVCKEVLKLELHEIGFLILVLYKIYTHINTVYKKYQNLINLQHAFFRFNSSVDEIDQCKENWQGKAKVGNNVDIEFKNVSFGYNNDNILSKLSLKIPAKGLTLLTGESGAGKTTIIDLICGFYKANEGDIVIKGKNISDMDMKEWRNSIGYVPQEPILLNDTIFKNIATFDETVTEERVIEALKKANAWKFVSSLSKAIHTEVGERGGSFSGGERQRLAVARALVHKPEVLILDEPTAAVDNETEMALIKTFKQLKKEMTIIAISHQPALTKIADKVIKIDKKQRKSKEKTYKITAHAA